ncbi:MAG: YigZ family protein [bacterium]|uniref:YigZ family protein n=1 Tax=Candidatus Aphodosoma intestinipullorum TaxID=2840674 RepID=A0A940DJA8_9BACT|nr:YigZ family protein [Candidatus Aphodosoma intestinipullorum]
MPEKNDTYLTIAAPSEAVYKDKGSKFLAFAYPVQTLEQVKTIIEQKRKEFYDARHVCYAYMLGYERAVFRANDDGEPSGTAGKPILGQINSAQLTDILIVVVRYFGGILLGTSGLIQAYKTAAAYAIGTSAIEERIVERLFAANCGYDMLNSVMRIVKECRLTVVSQRQELDCTLILSVRLSQIEPVKERFSKLDFVRFEEYVEAEVGE